MMKQITLVVILIMGFQLFGQSEEDQKVKQTIESFFEAFHEQDTIQLKSFTGPEITMQSIGLDKDGKSVLRTSNYSKFIKSIGSIPSDQKFEEKILSYSIQVDGAMANVWTPYEFWFNGAFSHCGVNSFQLMKVDDEWKIIYLVDTRRKECDF